VPTATPWLRACWQVAAFGSELQDGLLARRFLDEPVVLFRTSDGAVHALADRCAHRALPLSKGRRAGDVLECGYHGMRFGSDGSCLWVPGQDGIPPRSSVPCYPTVERYGFVWIWMGPAELADPALVPDAHWFDDPAWATAAGYLRFRCDYRLINDNLLDLSHETFVHQQSIGAAAVADSPVTAQIVDGTVRVQRMMRNFPPPPFYVKGLGFTGNIDKWHTTIYRPPGFTVIETASMPSGGDPAHARERCILHLITPETATTSHYFWGNGRKYDLDNPELTELVRSEMITVLGQDADVLEAQQQAFGPNPDDPFPVRIKVDAGPVLGRRLLEEQLRQYELV
jgi:phenylpropionate dioxygenase-like ring-hydroxylating dioxygenase large terminal subunit